MCCSFQLSRYFCSASLGDVFVRGGISQSKGRDWMCASLIEPHLFDYESASFFVAPLRGGLNVVNRGNENEFVFSFGSAAAPVTARASFRGVFCADSSQSHRVVV